MKVVPMRHTDVQKISELNKKLKTLRDEQNNLWHQINTLTTDLGHQYGVERPQFSSDYQYIVEGPRV